MIKMLDFFFVKNVLCDDCGSNTDAQNVAFIIILIRQFQIHHESHNVHQNSQPCRRNVQRLI